MRGPQRPGTRLHLSSEEALRLLEAAYTLVAACAPKDAERLHKAEQIRLLIRLVAYSERAAASWFLCASTTSRAGCSPSNAASRPRARAHQDGAYQEAHPRSSDGRAVAIERRDSGLGGSLRAPLSALGSSLPKPATTSCSQRAPSGTRSPTCSQRRGAGPRCSDCATAWPRSSSGGASCCAPSSASHIATLDHAAQLCPCHAARGRGGSGRHRPDARTRPELRRARRGTLVIAGPFPRSLALAGCHNGSPARARRARGDVRLSRSPSSPSPPKAISPGNRRPSFPAPARPSCCARREAVGSTSRASSMQPYRSPQPSPVSVASPATTIPSARTAIRVTSTRATIPPSPRIRPCGRAMEFALPLTYFVGVRRGVYKPVYPVYVAGEDAAHQEFMLSFSRTEVGTRLLHTERVREGVRRQDDQATAPSALVSRAGPPCLCVELCRVPAPTRRVARCRPHHR